MATGLTSMEENLMIGEWQSFPLLSGFGPTPPVPIVDVWNCKKLKLDVFC